MFVCLYVVRYFLCLPKIRYNQESDRREMDRLVQLNYTWWFIFDHVLDNRDIYWKFLEFMIEQDC